MQQKLSKFEQLKVIYGEQTATKIQTANILVVGAGGIGCELVKSLSLTGFTKMSIIDLDTIDISNLNRQFLFRREHVDQPKSFTLKNQIEKQNPQMKIDAFLGKIQEERFGFQFFKQFDLVINALDNEEARKHVNQMCFNLGKPLVDAGTNGYDMTCISIMKASTPCYQCVERKKDQSFPVCTIRQKPEKIIHCIVWAKALFEGLYGPKEAATQNIIEDIIEDLEKARQNSSESGNHTQFAQILIDKVFGLEPENLKKTLGERMKMEDCDAEEKASTMEFLGKIIPLYFKEVSFGMEVDQQTCESASSDQETQTKVHDVNQQVQNFIQAISILHTKRKTDIGTMMFSKDDHLSVEFVTAASNIRAHNFSVPKESLFKIKEMAGKIVPAISSSNALGASLEVIESIKLLGGRSELLKGIVYQRTNDKVRLNSFARANDDPNPDCQACDDSQSIFILSVKTLSEFTLGDFKSEVLTGASGVGMSGKSLIIEFNNNMIYEYDQEMVDGAESDDADEIKMNENRLKKSFEAIKVQNLSYLQAQGLINFADGREQEGNIIFQILHEPSLDSKFKVEVVKVGVPPKNKQPKQQVEEKKGQADNFEISSDECLIQDDDHKVQDKMLTGPGKRKHMKVPLETTSPDSPSPTKRQKL